MTGLLYLSTWFANLEQQAILGRIWGLGIIWKQSYSSIPIKLKFNDEIELVYLRSSSWMGYKIYLFADGDMVKYRHWIPYAGFKPIYLVEKHRGKMTIIAINGQLLSKIHANANVGTQLLFLFCFIIFFSASKYIIVEINKAAMSGSIYD